MTTETPFSEQQMLTECEHLGLRPYFLHIRNTADGKQTLSASIARKNGITIGARGGTTIAVLSSARRDVKERNFTQGIAHCSKQDNYCKATGRRLALHRALYGMLPMIPTETSVA